MSFRSFFGAAAAALLIAVGTPAIADASAQPTSAQQALVSSAIQAPKACKATISNARPQQYTTVKVSVSGVGSGARVTTTANYKTKPTKKAVSANSKGKSTTSYYISGATKNFKVVISVRAVKGNTVWSCKTAFTPR